jgi:hypothetical protein
MDTMDMTKRLINFLWPALAFILVMTGIGSSAMSREKNSLVMMGGMAWPSNGSGWITEHMEQGWSGYIEYCRRGRGRLDFYVNGRLLDHPVDVSGTTEEDKSVNTSTYGIAAGIKYQLLEREKFDSFAGAGVGFFSSQLLADSSVEDTSSGAGLDFNLSASTPLSSRFFLQFHLDYLMLFMGEGASFDELALSAGAGYNFGVKR